MERKSPISNKRGKNITKEPFGYELMHSIASLLIAVLKSVVVAQSKQVIE